MANPQSDLISFYLGLKPHPCGLTFDQILAWSDDQLEDSHDVVQWLFPTEKPSQANPDAPVLTCADVQSFLSSETLQARQLAALDRFMAFYGFEGIATGSIQRRTDFAQRTSVWMRSHYGLTPHNYLRITRILHSLQMLGSYDLAVRVQQAFLEVAEDHAGPIDEETRDLWLFAVSPDGPDEMGPNGVVLGPMRFADEEDLPIQSVSVEAFLQINALEALCSTQARIDAVAADLPFGGQFSLIPVDLLAQMLGVDLSGECDEYAEVARRMSIDEFDVSEIVEYLDDRLPAERVDEIRESGEFDPSELADRDLIGLEKLLAAGRIGEFNGDYPWVKRWTLTSSDGKIVNFQVCQGDGGSLSGLSGPYQAGRFDCYGDDDDYVVSDFELY